MTHFDLQEKRRKLGLKAAEMAARLKTPYRTYQDWEAGKRRIPGICEAAVEMLLERDAAFMERLKNRIVKNNRPICQNAP